MPLYSIFFEQNNQKVKDLITSNYKEHLFVEPNYCIISIPENVAASVIAKKLQILDEESERYDYGMVFKLNKTYAGYARGEIWDWLDRETS